MVPMCAVVRMQLQLQLRRVVLLQRDSTGRSSCSCSTPRATCAVFVSPRCPRRRRLFFYRAALRMVLTNSSPSALSFFSDFYFPVCRLQLQLHRLSRGPPFYNRYVRHDDLRYSQALLTVSLHLRLSHCHLGRRQLFLCRQLSPSRAFDWLSFPTRPLPNTKRKTTQLMFRLPSMICRFPSFRAGLLLLCFRRCCSQLQDRFLKMRLQLPPSSSNFYWSLMTTLPLRLSYPRTVSRLLRH
mmetsp:Transcript_12416/g.30122  ORF Transcript_12416/g.30122 Transcript_12416/m.30122 type:complete len:240 (-) Transcript_12416:747-1466(-)